MIYLIIYSLLASCFSLGVAVGKMIGGRCDGYTQDDLSQAFERGYETALRLQAHRESDLEELN
jgi:hypothetical protein